MQVTNNIARELAEKYNLDIDVILDMYHSQFQFTLKTIEALDVKREMDEEEFKSIKKNFNFPRLMSMYASYKQYRRIQNIVTNNKNQFTKKRKK